jgi:DNA-binding transcriptional MerR regulator/predicted transcriptional regulator YdeE
MNELTKIKDVSMKYAVTARTLRYYEDMGILTSVRTEDYAHRMYDETAITRLKQILILRKLNISIKDIQRIFMASHSEVVLEVLGKKAEDIDDELALLHELKEIVLDFIKQIKKSDFHNDAEVKLLYDKAKEIETQLSTSDYNGNPSNASRLLEVTDKLEDKRLTPPIAINTYKQSIFPVRFIGKKYASGGEAWNNWTDAWDIDSDNCLLKHFKVNPTKIYEDGNPQDGNALIGLMCHPNGDYNNFEYWLGYFTPENTAVPEGYEYVDFPKMNIGTCWLYGKEEDVMRVEPVAYEKLKEEGYEPITDWWFERYVPMREAEDKKGYKIMDICFFVK